MVAIVAGNGLGLFNTSLNTLGGGGVFGQGGLGQAGGQGFVNASNGNLILQFSDEQLSGLGLDLFHLRTYNAQGSVSDGDADGWRWDGERRLVLSGTRNATGSTVTRTTGDGHDTVYAWNGSRYQSGEGDGAHDALVWDAATSEWVWTDGSRRTVERYDGATGRLKSQAEAGGGTITYTYDANGRLTSVKDSSGQELVLVYNVAGKLERLDTRTTSGGALTRQVYYSYDASGRLSSVSTDLTPADNSIADGKVYTTSYTYDGSSFRIASVTQSDGTSVAYTYQLVGSEYRVKTVADASGTTTFTYDTTNRRTDVSNGLGQVWSYHYDTAGQLIQVQTPTTGGVRLSTSYSYDAQGNVLSIADGNGNVVTYGYDANGNRMLERDALGNTITRVYSGTNQLLNEIRYTVPATKGATVLYSNTLDTDTAGLTIASSPSLSHAGGKLVIKSAYDAATTFPVLRSQVTYAQNDGVIFRTEVQTSAVTDQIRALVGLENTGAWGTDGYRRHTINFAGNQFFANSTIGTVTQNTLLGSLLGNTLYVVEAEADAGGTTIYVYVSGQTREQGFSHRIDNRSWGQVRFFAEGKTDPSYTGTSQVTLDNITATRTTWTNPANSAAQTTRYVYDSNDRLRYAVDATGVVTEYRYGGTGLRLAEVSYGDALYGVASLAPTATLTEATLNTWAAARDKTQSRLTELAYDYRGNLTKVTAHVSVNSSGAGVVNTATQITEYIYSEHGQLLQTIAVRGTNRDARTTLSSTTYDGLGRVLSQIDASGTRTTVYNGASRQIAVTNSAGLTTTQTYDTRGRLVSISQTGEGGSGSVTRTTQYVYDAAGRLTMSQDPTGVRTYTFYDEAGRVSARVDGTGAVVEYIYNGAGQLTQEKAYANQVTAATLSTWYNGTSVTKTLVSQIRPSANTGADRVISHAYDSAGRRSSTTDAIGTVTTYGYDGRGQLVKVQTGDRVTRTFYDAAGRQAGQLDGEGYLRESIYNTTGQLQQVIRYAALTPAAQRESGTLAQLRPSATGALSTWYYYDNAGRQVGSVDEQGFVTETVFNEAVNTQQSIRYATAYTTAITTATTFATIRTAVLGGSQSTTVAFDGLGRASTRTGQDGTVTRYEYDTAGRLVKETAASGTTEARTLTSRYNAFGEVTGRLLGEASALVAAGMDPVQAYNQYGLTWSYDAAGRQVSVRDAFGNKTVTYYDEAGRVTHVVNALGEVKESLYNAFGEVREQTLLLTPLANPGSLTGGLNTTVKGQVAGLTIANDNKTTYAYDKRGLLTSTTDALSFLTSYAYNVHGERSGTTRTIASGNTVTESLSYSKRGELKSRTEDVGGLNRTTSLNYDAFGRVTSQVDGRGLTTTTIYDLNGRKITVRDPLNNNRSQTFDAWGRVLSETDALGQTTNYSYNDSTRALTVTTPDGVSISTTRNRHGEVITATDGKGQSTTYTYNKDGQLLTVKNALNQTTTTNGYDGAGRLLTVKDALNNTTTYAYDAASRVVRRTDALGTVTSYAFDGQGRQTTVTEAVGLPEQRVTQYTYDSKGQVLTVIQDPSGLALRTTYSYDGLGQQLEVKQDSTASVGLRITRYTFDKLGRRIREQVDPSGLNISTEYRYNGNDQVTRKIDARGNSTWYVYDNAGRLTDTIDALGGLTRNTYDAAGNVTSVTRYATAVATSSFGDVVASVTAPAVTNAQRTFYIYDNVGRVRYTIQSLSTGEAVTETVYDANGRVTESRQYDKAIAANTTRTLAATATALTTAGAVAISTTYVYDNAGRLTSTTDALNKTESYTYDALGNRKTLKNKNNAVWTYNYDALGRLTEEITPQLSVSSITAAGVVSANNRYLVTTIGYDALGNVTSRVEGRQRTAVANVASSDDLSQARTTTYGYDKVGRQTLITSPGWYNKSTGAFQQASDGTANTFQVTTEVTYDALGNATRNRVRVSNTGTTTEQFVDSYKTYDAVGRVVHEIDALSGVTTYTYDKLGNALTIKRHASALNFAVPALGYYLASDITTARLVPDAANDRTLTMTYDLAGRKTSVQQDQVSLYTFTGSTGSSTTVTAAPTTVYSYNALGQLTKETQIARNSSGATVQTGVSKTWYYDVAGNQVGLVTGVPGTLGYYTKSEYNALGQLTRQIEYAKALTTSWTEAAVPSISTDAKDRSTAYAYDSLGRLIRVTQENVTYWTQSINAATQVVTASQVTGNLVVSETTYDGVGNVLTQQDAASNVTTTQYNALGQITKVIEPARSTAKAGVVDPFTAAAVVASPTTTYNVNAFGQVVRATRVAGQDAGGNTQAGLAQVTRTVYDAAGNEIREIDATSVGIVDYKVDAAGRRTEESQLVSATMSAWTVTSTTKKSYSQTLKTTYTHDKLGRQTATAVWYTAANNTQQATTNSVEYNRFGEIDKERLNGFLTASYSYDRAGRAITQTNTQGLTQVSYNLGGQVSRSIQAGDTTITTDDRITYTRHNAIDQVIEQHLPAFEANLNADTLNNTTLTLTTPIIKQTVDRWGNALTRTDARNQTTTWTYNHNNQVLTETLPQTDILRENGTSYRASLIHEQRHDALGRVIQEADLVGPYTGMTTTTHLRTRQKVYNEVGQVVREVDALGHGSRYLFDSNGNRIASQNALGTVLTQTYDAMGRQLTHGIIRSGARTVLQTNQYDQAGRLYGEIAGTTAIEETLQSTANSTGNNPDWKSTTTGVAGNTKYTVWDERGNVAQTRNESKIEKFYEYDQGNRKVEERDGLTNTLTWTYDDTNYGRLSSRKDLGNRIYSYTYNAFGQIKVESLTDSSASAVPLVYQGTLPPNIAPNKVWEYYGNGLIRSISEEKTVRNSSGVVIEEDYKKTSYEYLADSNYAREINSAKSYGVPTNYGQVILVEQEAQHEVRYGYDEIGRLQRVVSPAGSYLFGGLWVYPYNSNGFMIYRSAYDFYDSAKFDILYYYDEFGGRRRVVLDTTNQSGARVQEDNWFKYDLEGRVIVSDGYKNNNNQIVAGTQGGFSKGYAMTYDVAGRRLSSEQWDRSIYHGGSKIAEHYRKERYTYSDLNYILQINERFLGRAVGADSGQDLQNIVNPSTGVNYYLAEGSEVLRADFLYDGFGFRLAQTEYDSDGLAKNHATYSYRGDGLQIRALTYNVKDGANKLSQANYFGEAGMLDAAGNQAAYRYVVYKADGASINYRGNYTKSYAAFDSYKESRIVATWSKSGSPGETNLTYSARGDILRAIASGGVSFSKSYASNRAGSIIARRDKVGTTYINGRAQGYVYYNGAEIARVGNLSAPEISNTLTPVSINYPVNTPSSYVINEGDNLQRIAQMIWGDSRMWYLIAEANGLDPALPLVSGDTLKIPNVVASNHNDATTFKAYNPAEVIGNTTPSPRPPSAKKKCSGLAQLVQVVVTAVLTVALTPVMGPAGPAAAAAIGDFYGQVTSQIANGEFDWGKAAWGFLVGGFTGAAMAGSARHYDYARTAIAAASAYATAQVSGLQAGQSYQTQISQMSWSAAAKGAFAGNLVNQGANLALGRQESFSWGSLASSVIAPPPGANFPIAGAIMSSAWRQTIQFAVDGEGKYDWASIAIDAFGNALGNSIATKLFPKAQVPLVPAPKAETNVAAGTQSESGAPGAQVDTSGKVTYGGAASVGNSLLAPSSHRDASASGDVTELASLTIRGGSLLADDQRSYIDTDGTVVIEASRSGTLFSLAKDAVSTVFLRPFNPLQQLANPDLPVVPTQAELAAASRQRPLGPLGIRLQGINDWSERQPWPTGPYNSTLHTMRLVQVALDVPTLVGIALTGSDYQTVKNNVTVIEMVASAGTAGATRRVVQIIDVPNKPLTLSHQASSGVVLKTEAGRTTTILGSYSKDMKAIIDELGNVKSMDFGQKLGGFNVLNAPDELFTILGPKGFWDNVNVPFLSAATTRGDNLLMATKPAFDVVDSHGLSVLVRPNVATGKMELTGFGKEYLTLRRDGYIYQNGVMVKK